MLCCALRFVGAKKEAVFELFASGEMVLCLAHWHLYVLQFFSSHFESSIPILTDSLVSLLCVLIFNCDALVSY